VRYLLDAGADVNASGGYFGPAIQAAATAGELEIVQLMIDMVIKTGANVNSQTNTGATPLHCALTAV